MSTTQQPHMTPGVFVVFEGGEGAGKTTQADRLAYQLIRDRVPVLITRQPGGSPRLGTVIRQQLLDPTLGPLPSRAETLLLAAEFACHAEQVIWPALERGEVVICDRYTDSLLAYQGFGRKLGSAAITQIADWATSFLLPDLVVFLDIDPQAGLVRAAARSGPDRIEAETDDTFHQRVRDGFRWCARRGPGRYLILDATAPADELTTQITARVAQLLNKRRQTHDLPRGAKVIAMKDRRHGC